MGKCLIRRINKMTYEIINLDVWGNKKDGYEVNQAFSTGRFIELNEDYTNKELRKNLFTSGYFGRGILNAKLEIIDSDSDIYINHVSNRVGWLPLIELRKIKGE